MDKYRHKRTGEIIEVVCLDEAFMLSETPAGSWVGEAYKKYNPIPIRSNEGRVFALSDMSEHKYGELYFRKFILGARAKIGEVSCVSQGDLTLNWDKINEAITKDNPVIKQPPIETYQKYRHKITGHAIEAVCIDGDFMMKFKDPSLREKIPAKVIDAVIQLGLIWHSDHSTWKWGDMSSLIIGDDYIEFNEEHTPMVITKRQLASDYMLVNEPIEESDSKPYCADQVEKTISAELAVRELGGEVTQDEIGQFSFPKGIKANEIASKIADTMNQRAQDRGEKEERSMARTVAMFNALKGQNLMSEHDGWRFMEILKMVRSEIGSKFVLDDYIDGGAYCFLAGECRSQQLTTEQQ